MTTPEKAKGSQWERDVAKYFQLRGFDVERRYGAGAQQDKGDLRGIPGFTIECKNLKTISLASIVDETMREMNNAGTAFGVAIIKRRRSSAAEGYAVMTLENFVDLLEILLKDR